MQKADLLLQQLSSEKRGSSNVSTWAIERTDEAQSNWITPNTENDRNCSRGRLGHGSRRTADRGDHGHPTPNHFRGKRRQLVVPFGRVDFQGNIVTVSIAGFAQAVAECEHCISTHTVEDKAIKVAGEKLGVQLNMVPVRTVEDFEGVFSEMTQKRVDGFLVVASLLSYLQRTSLAEFALYRRLPGMFGRKENVEAGGLMSY